LFTVRNHTNTPSVQNDKFFMLGSVVYTDTTALGLKSGLLDTRSETEGLLERDAVQLGTQADSPKFGMNVTSL